MSRLVLVLVLCSLPERAVSACAHQVADAFATLYPPSEFAMRNSRSRKDGYWPYVSKKKDPPLVLTYGEFPLDFFARVTDRACVLAGIDDAQHGGVFCDVGSGAGRLVLWAAATRAWSSVHGVELLPSLHAAAMEKRAAASALDEAGTLSLRAGSVHLHEGSWEDGALMQWDGVQTGRRSAWNALDLSLSLAHASSSWCALDAGVDVAFAYTTAFPHDEAGVLSELSRALKARLRRGAVVCTTDYKLDTSDGFEVVEEMSGANEGVGGTSVAYIHRKISEGESYELAVGRRTAELTARVASLESDIAQREPTRSANATHTRAATLSLSRACACTPSPRR